MTAAQKILFIDRDGTLIEEPEDYQVDRIDKIRLVRDVMQALARFRDAGYRLVMVSNQDGLGTASFPTDDFEIPHRFMIDLFESQGIHFDDVLICPHLPDDGCDCRKPRAGLLTQLLARTTIDLDASAVVGDRETDIELAKAIGVRGFLLDDALRWSDIAHELIDAPRRGRVTRDTNETRIEVSVDLDAPAPQQISTGIGFFDHMLEQIARHGRFALALQCDGDLDVDDHHSVEDVALALGSALRQALGNKRGITRYGSWVPMDEALAHAVIDLSGRPACRFDVDIGREFVGGLASEMVPHFFQSLSQSLGAAIHVSASGDNAHHIVEGCFKGVGRALGRAFSTTGDSDVPSTKGTL